MNVAEHWMRTTAIGLGGAVRSGSGKSGRVSKGEMAKFDFAARLGVFGDFRVAVIDIRFGREDVIQPAHGGRATLKDICNPSQGDHGPDEHGEITVKGNERTARNLPLKALMAALPHTHH